MPLELQSLTDNISQLDIQSVLISHYSECTQQENYYCTAWHNETLINFPQIWLLLGIAPFIIFWLVIKAFKKR